MDIRVDSAGHRTATCKRAIHVAAEDGHAAVLRALLEANADPNALATIETPESTSHTTALFSARRSHHAEAVAVLEAAGATEESSVGV
jgi:ankyrin repeat protein